jgi:hypothetical protein
LIIASLLLLVAMVGAVGLTLKRPVAAPDYDVFAQHYVDFQKGLVQIKNKSVWLQKEMAAIFYPQPSEAGGKKCSILIFILFFYEN